VCLTGQDALANIYSMVMQNNQLLLKLIAQQEDVKQTQRVHTAYLHALQQQRSVTGGLATKELPRSIKIPFKEIKDVDEADAALKDPAAAKIMVITIHMCQKIVFLIIHLLLN